jgi:DSF synthase
VFNLGGDLDHFAARMRVRDRQALVAYGESCVRILHRNIECLGLPIVTIGLAQGDAPGGGFESLLSFNIIIAEHGAKFGFPESISACSRAWGPTVWWRAAWGQPSPKK